MELVSLLTEHSQELGDGATPQMIKALEAKLDISIPGDFKEYLVQLNYAEVFGDPIYGIHPDLPSEDLYTQNKNKEHFNYGFLEVFSNDIDGNIYIRPDSGAVYNASFSVVLAKNFTEFVKVFLDNGS